MIKGINELAERAFNNAVKRRKTTVDNITYNSTLRSLADEFAEFVIANEYLKSEHIPSVSQVVEELTDIAIVCFTELHRRGIDVEKMLLDKIEFNEKRE